MSAVKIESVFSSDFVPVIKAYVSMIEEVLSRYDDVVFVARKAICFYNALKKNGEINSFGANRKSKREPRVLSSRALGYRLTDLTKGKVALVDDVLISGSSVLRAKQDLEMLERQCDIFVAALCTSIMKEGAIQAEPDAIAEFDRQQVYELAEEITEYIQASAVTNNVDQPIYWISFEDNESLQDVLNDCGWLDIATDTQMGLGIVNSTRCMDPEILFGDLLSGIVNNPADIMAKVRLFSDGSSVASFVPFVILPELTYDKIERLFDLVAFEDLASYAQGASIEDTVKNKLRIVQYALSLHIAERMCDSWGGVLSRVLDQNNEVSLFGRSMDGLLRPAILSADAVKKSIVPSDDLTDDVLRRGLNSIYQALIRSDRHLEDDRAQLRYSRCASVTDSYITVDRARRALASTVLSSETRTDALASACFDNLVDSGVIVPFVGYRYGNGSISAIRAFRGGEILELAYLDLQHFSFCVGKYGEEIGEPVPEATANQLGTLFLFLYPRCDTGRVEKFTYTPSEQKLMRDGVARNSTLCRYSASKKYLKLDDNGCVISATLDEGSLLSRTTDKALKLAVDLAKIFKTLNGEIDPLLVHLTIGYSWRRVEQHIACIAHIINDCVDGFADDDALQDLEHQCENCEYWLPLALDPDGMTHKIGDLLSGSGLKSYEVSHLITYEQYRTDEQCNRAFHSEVSKFLTIVESLIALRKDGYQPSASDMRLVHDRWEVIELIDARLKPKTPRDEMIRFYSYEIGAICATKKKDNFKFAIAPRSSHDHLEITIARAMEESEEARVFFWFLEGSEAVAITTNEVDKKAIKISDTAPRRIVDIVTAVTNHLFYDTGQYVVTLCRNQEHNDRNNVDRFASSFGVTIGHNISLADISEIKGEDGLCIAAWTIEKKSERMTMVFNDNRNIAIATGSHSSATAGDNSPITQTFGDHSPATAVTGQGATATVTVTDDSGKPFNLEKELDAILKEIPKSSPAYDRADLEIKRLKGYAKQDRSVMDEPAQSSFTKLFNAVKACDSLVGVVEKLTKIAPFVGKMFGFDFFDQMSS